jgi:integrase
MQELVVAQTRAPDDGQWPLLRDPELRRPSGVRARPRGLRHASITTALDTSNGDVRAAQAHARHANPQTTMRYDDNRQDLAGKVAAGLAAALLVR